MLMPFGKHKGQNVSTLPKRYLQWLRQNVELNGELAAAVSAALGIAPKQERSVDALVDQIIEPFGA